MNSKTNFLKSFAKSPENSPEKSPAKSPAKFQEKSLPAIKLLHIIFLIIFSLNSSAQTAPTTTSLQVLSLTPNGSEVPTTRQITIAFNKDVVPLGKMERASEDIPVKTYPNLNCNWHWINTSILACDLNEKDELKISTKYKIEILKEHKGAKFTAIDGSSLDKNYTYNIETESVKITDYIFSEWIDARTPKIRLTFNTPIDHKSLAKKIQFLNYNIIEDPSTGRFKADGAPKIVQASIADSNYYGGTPEETTFKNRVWSVTPSAPLKEGSKYEIKIIKGILPLGYEENTPKDILVPLKDDQIILSSFTPKKPKFLGIQCWNNQKAITNFDYPVFENENFREESQNQRDYSKNTLSALNCDPLNPINLVFTTPLKHKPVNEFLKLNPNPFRSVSKKDKANNDTDKTNTDGDEEDSYEVHYYNYYKFQESNYSDIFRYPLPYGLKSKLTYEISLADTAIDIYERKVENNVNEKVYINPRKPNITHNNYYEVLELNTNTTGAGYFTNLSEYQISYQGFNAKKEIPRSTMTVPLPIVEDIAIAEPLPYRNILENSSGVIAGTISSTKYPAIYPAKFTTQITPYNIHLKLGHNNSIAWITDYQTGEPVSDATLEVFTGDYQNPKREISPIEVKKTNRFGIAELSGTAKLDPDLILDYYQCSDCTRNYLQVRATKNGEIATLPAISDFEDYTRFYSTLNKKLNHTTIWGTTAQGIYKVGDTVDYAIWARDQNNQSLIAPELTGWTLTITDPMEKQILEKEISFNGFGVYSDSIAIAPDSPVGFYTFSISRTGEKTYRDKSWYPLKVLVSDFTPSPFKVTNYINESFLEAGKNYTLKTEARLYAGGPYANSKLTINAQTNCSGFNFEDSKLEQLSFNTCSNNYFNQTVFSQNKEVDQNGDNETSFSINSNDIFFGNLLIESTVIDERGKGITGSINKPYFARDLLVGIGRETYFSTVDQDYKINFGVINTAQKLVPNIPVTIKVQRAELSKVKAKSSGESYLDVFEETWVDEQTHQVQSTPSSSAVNAINNPSEQTPELLTTLSSLNIRFSKVGRYRVTATVKDGKDREHSSDIEVYATGKGYYLWDTRSTSNLELISEKNNYKAGDTAKILVKNPYPGAHALISIERYGIIDSFEKILPDSSQVIELPIKDNYLPGVYVSVLIFSPRAKEDNLKIDPYTKEQLDLAKPSHKIGKIKLLVNDPATELNSEIKTERTTYKPGELVNVDIKPTTPTKDGISYAVTVLDESVFDLLTSGYDYFDLHKGMYSLQEIDVKDFTLLKNLVGKRNFEKKGASQGGDGYSKINTRDFFKFVSYWNANLKGDSNGNAKFNFKAPDNLTNWKILVIAYNESDKFGLSQSSFKVNKETEIRSALPNQISTGDKFIATFSLLNRTDKPRTLSVSIKADGENIVNQNGQSLEESHQIELKGFEKRMISLPINTKATTVVKADEPKKYITFSVTAKDGIGSDQLITKLQVIQPQNNFTYATSGTTTKNEVTIPLSPPTENSLLKTTFSPTIITGIVPAFEYLSNYPYGCWEQKLTKLLGGMEFLNLKRFLPDNFKYNLYENYYHTNNSVDFTLTDIQNTINNIEKFQSPSGRMSYFVPYDSYASPYLSTYTALGLNYLHRNGIKIPANAAEKLTRYLERMLKIDAFPDFYSRGMASDTRAVALASLTENNHPLFQDASSKLEINYTDFLRHYSELNHMSLFGRSFILQSALNLKANTHLAQPLNLVEKNRLEGQISEIYNAILSFSDLRNETLSFSETVDFDFQRIHESKLRTSCAILSSLVKAEKELKISSVIVPNLARTINETLSAKSKELTTQDSIFCILAISDYAREYEKNEPNISINQSINNFSIGTINIEGTKSKPQSIEKELVLHTDNKTSANSSALKLPLELKFTNTTNSSDRYYYRAEISYYDENRSNTPINHGFEIAREYSILKDGTWKVFSKGTNGGTNSEDNIENLEKLHQGDIIRTDIYLSLPAPRLFVVVEDPLAGGLEILNNNLKTTSQIIASQGRYTESGFSTYYKHNDWIEFSVDNWSFYHKELRHESARFYSEYLPKGNYHLSYISQVISKGEFLAKPAIAQEMYHPETFGKTTQKLFKFE